MRRPRLRLAAGLGASLALVAAAGAAGPARPAGADGGEEPLRRVVVTFERPAAPADLAADVRRAGGEPLRWVDPRRVAVLVTPAEEAALRADPAVGSVTADRRVVASPVVRVSGTPVDGRWGLVAVDGPRAWGVTAGRPTVALAVLDGGVDPTLPALVGRVDVLRGCRATNSRTLDDVQGHGTAVAAVAAAGWGDPSGVAGLAPGVRVLSCKVLDDLGRGWSSDVAAGLRVAVDAGAAVINMSFNGPDDDPVLAAAVADARARGVVLVAAAGNTVGDVPQYPAAHPGVVAVGAADRDGSLLWFSARGAWVDVLAPGRDVLVPEPGGGLALASGTSVAAPFVAGAAALVRSWAAALPAAVVAGLLGDGAARPAGVPPELLSAGDAVRFPYPGMAACPRTVRGLLLLADGSLVAVGGAPDPGPGGAAARWPGEDRARGLALAPGGAAGWVLDAGGAVDAFGGAPPASPVGGLPAGDVARGLVARPDGAGLYLLTADGAVRGVGLGGAPAPQAPRPDPIWPGLDVARDLALAPGSATAGWVLAADGSLTPFGGAPPLVPSGALGGARRAVRLVVDPGGRGVWVLDTTGRLHPRRPEGGSAGLPRLAASSVPVGGARGAVVGADGSGAVVTAAGAEVVLEGPLCGGAPRWGGDVVRAVVAVP
ncbi:MAG: S8 family serine peptidase [Acidimicrobiales bacterium]|nr:S8 family serine peptidase [Acidimicrobiales bacterium]